MFAGLIGIIDPPRAEARDAVARARQAGIRPIMIPATIRAPPASSLANSGLALDGRTTTGAELEKLSADALRARQPMCPCTRGSIEHSFASSMR